ncbi:GH116 family glycosyl-hydrolase [Mucilaginibacter sp.]|uniref:GH116 family glycosyl-hydrolase n=1 Tax=Mucilaginibacter sp. TaxID=1882438 RepID=UPI0025D7B728|nr:GH116 family glycosyl-hydrolase [Mucilaginibacter sp.]
MKNIKRRDFLRNTGLITAGLLVARVPVMASAKVRWATKNGPLQLDKNQDQEWVKSLYNRGTTTTYLKTKNELQYIGMPVGGINCGTLYLGGDGRLWLWDIFNKNQEGIEPKVVKWDHDVQGMGEKVRSRDGACYIQPSKDIRPLEQGFAIKVKYQGNTITKRIHQDDWDEIKFEATYPLAVVHYIDNRLPLDIKLTAFSPFIPLDEDNSNIPVTVQSFEIKNTGTEIIDVEIAGWLENAVNKFSATANCDGKRVNTVINKTDHVSVFSTFKAVDKAKYSDAGDTGSMCLSFIGKNAMGISSFSLPFSAASFNSKITNEAVVNADEKLIAGIVSSQQLSPGESIKKEFVISWHFPNVGVRIDVPDARTGHYYLNKFSDALAVADYVAERFSYLTSQTKLWNDTWFNSSLPHWFLERTFLNISALATTTSHRFKTGRSWAWEGVGACEGNCTHVWQYAQAIGRVFPGIERDNRQRVDLGISLQEDGGIWFRGEYNKRPAIDGQAGRVLGCLREHQMSADSTFLKNNWVNIKKATQFIINADKNGDGMTDTPMENTLDAIWDGEIAWIVGLCIAAVKAGGVMAEEMNDAVFAARCKEYATKGIKNMDDLLFNGEYYIHRPDAVKGRAGIGSYNTCHIDQVLGQSWAWQVGMGRINNKEKTVSALKSLWKYNFMQDVGPFEKQHSGWRPYALPGESGMVMNTNPKDEPHPYGESATWQMGYFYECMTGFEHQVSSHLMAEGMTDEALVLTRAIHDRYHAFKRNPFNEIECSDHYGRAMASYGTFITACGFEYHGPKGFIRFAPKWDKENFKSPFTAAQSWGTYSQTKTGGKQEHLFEVKYGSLQLQKISLEKMDEQKVNHILVMMNGQKVSADFIQTGTTILVTLPQAANIKTNELLMISI